VPNFVSVFVLRALNEACHLAVHSAGVSPFITNSGHKYCSLVDLFQPRRDAPMNTVCTCGFDYGDFVAQHQIPRDARFNCPRCDIELQSGFTGPAAESLDANLPLRARPAVLSGAAAES
jgi:hypothetical protein